MEPMNELERMVERMAVEKQALVAELNNYRRIMSIMAGDTPWVIEPFELAEVLPADIEQDENGEIIVSAKVKSKIEIAEG